MTPDRLVDRNDACQILGISRQTLTAWIHKGKLKVWKRVGHGSNAPLLFDRKHIESIKRRALHQTTALSQEVVA